MSHDAPLSPASLLEAFAREIAGAVAALAGATTELVPGASAAETAWLADVAASGVASGSLHLSLTEADARRVSAVIMGFDPAEVGDDAIADTLRELCSQAIGALSQAPATAAVTLTIAEVVRKSLAGPPAAGYSFALDGGDPITLVLGGDVALDPAREQPAPAAVAVAASAPVLAAVAPAASQPARASAPSGQAPGNLDLLLDIQLPLAVRFGATELALQTLTRLGPGSVIDLHRSADEPVEVLVSGKVIARGEVVVVEGNYGVRITEVVSAADRIRSLGA